MRPKIQNVLWLAAIAASLVSPVWSVSGVSAQMPPCTASTPAGGGPQGCEFTGSAPPGAPQGNCLVGTGIGGNVSQGCGPAGSFSPGQAPNCTFATFVGAPAGGAQPGMMPSGQGSSLSGGGPVFFSSGQGSSAAGAAPSGLPPGFAPGAIQGCGGSSPAAISPPALTPAGSSGGGSYCTLSSGGQVWVPAGGTSSSEGC